MTTTYDSHRPLPEVRVVTAVVAVPSTFAYEATRQVELLPKWASGLAADVQRKEGAWYADSPMGQVRLEMAEPNTLGVLDHEVTLPDGAKVHNAFRVSPVDEHHCAFTFLVIKQPDQTTEAFRADVLHVERDLAALKELLESEAYGIELANAAISGLEDVQAGRVGTPQDLDALLFPAPPKDSA